jgi:hypothetical protein
MLKIIADCRVGALLITMNNNAKIGYQACMMNSRYACMLTVD